MCSAFNQVMSSMLNPSSPSYILFCQTQTKNNNNKGGGVPGQVNTGGSPKFQIVC